MAEAELEQEITVTLTLSEEEATYLIKLTRNYLGVPRQDLPQPDESTRNNVNRSSIFGALNSALVNNL